MATSTITVVGALEPLREGQLQSEREYMRGRRWFVGGQSDRSRQIAMHALENLLDGPEGYRVGSIFSGRPHRCASARFGNCLTFDLLTPAEYERDRAIFGSHTDEDAS